MKVRASVLSVSHSLNYRKALQYSLNSAHVNVDGVRQIPLSIVHKRALAEVACAQAGLFALKVVLTRNSPPSKSAIKWRCMKFCSIV